MHSVDRKFGDFMEDVKTDKIKLLKTTITEQLVNSTQGKLTVGNIKVIRTLQSVNLEEKSASFSPLPL